jgi:Fe-S oxidoreductase
VTPCPVNIDFGDVSMNMRNLLRKMDKRSFKPANRAAMFFLNATDPTTINATRKAMVDWGYKAQRLGASVLKAVAKEQTKAPPPTTGKAPIREQVIHFVNKKMPGNLPKKTARALLDIEDDKVIPIIRNPKATNADTEAVFYFPGCGSERLFSQVGLATQAMLFLNATDPTTIKLTKKAMIDWGFKAQRLGYALGKRMGLVQRQTRHPPPTHEKQKIKAQVIHIINKPMPGGLPKRTARALLDIEDNTIVPIIRDPQKVNEDSDAVFYFPGCGSERLFGQVGLATQAMLYHLGVQTVLPPGYLCCGYPQTSAGDADKGTQITTSNRVLFHRVANTLNYLDIKTVIVSCGTCMDQLMKYEFERIFPGCRLLDIHEYLLEKDVKLEGITGVRYMYHDPCHTPMKTYQPLKVVNQLMGSNVELNDRCCGESGTFATTRPDIATQVRLRKEEEMRKGATSLRTDGFTGDVKVLTSCPSCLQGLQRYREDASIDADYIVVEIAKHILGDNWMPEFVDKANHGGIERVLV